MRPDRQTDTQQWPHFNSYHCYIPIFLTHISLKFTWQIKQKSIYVLNLIGSTAILLLSSQNFSETTLLRVQHNFGVIFKLVFSLSLFFFSFSISDNQVKKFLPLKVSDSHSYFIHHNTFELIKMCWNYIYSCHSVASRKMWRSVEPGQCFIPFAVGIQSRVEDEWMIKWILFIYSYYFGPAM